MNTNFLAFLTVLLNLGGDDVPAYAIAAAAFGKDMMSLTTGAATLHAAASKGFIIYERNTDRVYITQKGRNAIPFLAKLAKVAA